MRKKWRKREDEGRQEGREDENEGIKEGEFSK